jgi:hypothetical protein
MSVDRMPEAIDESRPCYVPSARRYGMSAWCA